ncbi:thioredoxin-dependent thiol peroxidase [Marispirochaeta sp.]|uniref:thioredoxin-dependent thiol peroxidase n=1 Tax=Marispirochaeta sp. TaxID=2038653 RepID=UPI0029C73978|nr:thioredoxin-dependent thiol peroxidase [Marispirochaeta sp.]
MVEEGTVIEDFSLQDGEGQDVSLSDFSGKKVVVYFYPKDNTPGCTKEACSFRDNYDAILDKGAVVLGISADSVQSHGKFKAKFDLPFYLLSDPDKKVLKRFGAWGEKKMYGKTYEGILRSTFILDEDRRVIKVFPKVSPSDHGSEILTYL